MFLDQLEKLISAVADDQKSDPANFAKKANAKLLKAIYAIAFERIPSDPTNQRYRLSDTLGDDYTHWFRDKFGNGRFRIFFRYDSKTKIIIFVWINDGNTLREYGARSDAYAVFSKMLKGGNPPDGWEALLASCKAAEPLRRLGEASKKATQT